MSFRLEGFDELQRTLDQATKALGDLDGEIATLSFDPGDPASVEAALVQLDMAIDSKIAPYRGNELVETAAANLKQQYRSEILNRAEEAVRGSQIVKGWGGEISAPKWRLILERCLIKM